MNSELGRIRKEAVVTSMKVQNGISMEGLSKTAK
jgi:hypothetical protein